MTTQAVAGASQRSGSGGKGLTELRPRTGQSGPISFLSRLFRNAQAKIGGLIILVLLITAVLAPILAPYDPYQLRVGGAKEPPSAAHPFGTDDIGRDMLS